MRLKKNIALSESGFVFDPSSGDSYSLNEQARVIIGYLKEGLDLDAISSRVTEEYDIDRVSFEKYYFDFLAMLKHYNLIEGDE